MAEPDAPAPSPSEALLLQRERDAAQAARDLSRDGMIQYVATLAALITVTIMCAALHYPDAMNTALGGFLGFATSGRPASGVPRPLVAATTIGLALAAGSLHLVS
jgi:hypothetical protein